jgi:hypothetical protein
MSKQSASERFEQWVNHPTKKKAKQRLMDPLDWAVYRVIEKTTLERHRPATLREIVDAIDLDLTLPEDLKFVWNEKDRNHCRAVWTVVKHINDSDEVEKIVVIDGFTYCLGNKDQSYGYIAKLVRDARKKLARAYRMKKKADSNGRGKLLSCQGKEIDASSEAEPFVESFVDFVKSVPEDDGDEESEDDPDE